MIVTLLRSLYAGRHITSYCVNLTFINYLSDDSNYILNPWVLIFAFGLIYFFKWYNKNLHEVLHIALEIKKIF